MRITNPLSFPSISIASLHTKHYTQLQGHQRYPRLRSVLTRVTDPPRYVLHTTTTLLFCYRPTSVCPSHHNHTIICIKIYHLSGALLTLASTSESKKKARSHFPVSGQAVNHRCRPFLLSPVYTCLRFYRAEANRFSFLLLVHFSSTFLIHALALSAAEEDPEKGPVQLQY